jgi:hypothetical protein
MKKHEESAMKCTRLVCLIAALLVASAAWAGLHDAPYAYGFDGWTAVVDDWTNSGTATYTTAGNYGVASPSVKFDGTGDYIISPTIDNPDSVKFWTKGQNTGNSGAFVVYARVNGGSWAVVRNCTFDSLAVSGDILRNVAHTVSFQLSATYQGQEDVDFKISYDTKVLGNIAFDDFTVTAYSAAGDTTPPSISSLSIISNTQLDVLFSEAVDQTTAETEGNYAVTPGSTSPSSALRDGTNNALVHLTFASALPVGTDTLTVNGVEDLSNNACTNATGTFVITQTVNVGDVVINEVMYDDTALVDTEWVELHNTTGSEISVAGWYLTDDDTYPVLSSEGAITIPAGTTIPANGYLVLCKTALSDITDEIVCTQSGSFALNNDGDNLALYTAATGGTLIDGSLTVNYPDLSTPGYSIEKCDEHAAWDGSASAWHMSTNVFGTARYLYCTPGAANTVCVDLTPPGISSVTVISNTQLDVLFDEPVEQTTAETEADYVVTPGGATPSSALRDGSDIFLVHLTFASSLPVGTDTLTVNAVEDTSSNHNACVNARRTFVISGGDLTPPGIVSVTPLSKTALDVLFDEPVDLTTAETEANYTVIPGNANPSSALRDATNLALVHLVFASNLPAGTDTLNVNAVQDTSSNHNACSNVQKTFNIPLANEGDVVINEIMYDDTASTDSEWVELYNRTASAIDISGWVILDAATYPVSGSEGGFYLPASTSIPAHGYLVVSRVALDGIVGEVIGTQYSGSWTLGNSGDNVGLYTDTVGGLRIDGWATSNTLLFYPDWSSTNGGVSLEKCNEDSPWPADSTGWHASTNLYSSTGRFRFCTPGATNSPCVADTVRPTLVSATVVTNMTLDVVFSEPVELTTSQTVTNYSVNNGVGNPASATRQVNQTTVRLVFASAMSPNNYILTVNNVTDLANNAILPNSTIGFTVTAPTYNIIFTEFMPNPNFAGLADSLGEWFEIYNAAASAVDMSNWVISDNAGRDTLEGPVSIGSHDYFVFCSKGDSAINGGVPVDFAYRYATSGWGLSLSNTADILTLKDAAGNVIATQSYTTAFHWAAGQSAQLKDLSYNGAMDTSWCIAEVSWPGAWNGDRGTPGAPTICPGPVIPDTVTICSIRVQNVCGVPVLLHRRVAARGVISFADTCRATAYMQSGGCGVAIYGGALFDTMQGSTRLPAAGDSVAVDGFVTQYNGLTEINTYSSFVPVITFISAGHTVTPVEIACTDIGLHADSCRGENFESEMVHLSNVTFINPSGNFPMADSNYAVLCGTDTVYFRTDSCDTALIGTAIPSEQIHITGVLGQYDNTSCYCRGYQLLYGGGTTFTPARCADPESLTVIRDVATDAVVLRWKRGAGQTCNCYEIYWADNAITVWPTGYTYLAHVVGSTTYTDALGAQVRRFYRVTAGGPHCP